MSELLTLSPLLQSLLATLLTWGVTALGAALVLFARQAHPLLMDALLARRAEIPDGVPLVFPEDVARLKANGNSENISREMTRLFERAGIATSKDGTTGKRISVASFHSLRHTFVSRLMERGVNPYYVQRAVGHSTMTMTAHYDHSAAEAIRDALDT